jgi:hypothetical protein
MEEIVVAEELIFIRSSVPAAKFVPVENSLKLIY